MNKILTTLALTALTALMITPSFATAPEPQTVPATPAPVVCAISVADLDAKIKSDPQDFSSYRDLGQYVFKAGDQVVNVEVFYEGKGENGVDTYLVIALTNETDKCVDATKSPFQTTDDGLAKVGIKIVSDVK